MADEHGFTLPEIMVAMIVSSIMISLGLGLFLFANKLFKMWYDGTELRSDVNRTVQVLAYDIQQSREVLSLTDSTMTLRLGGGRDVVYRFAGDSVTRNSVSLYSRETGTIRLTVGVESSAKSRLYRIEAVGICRNSRYEAGAVAAIPYSSRAAFHIVSGDVK